ncbi:hypothetical protein [Streptomyces sp. NBC_01314]|uniref:hypothetical protein n=1 Tax=Streptomyces sp. NBC_01314 TaxID=2903821 RepID=UPI0030906FF4|nr:hypothetical protein OG622_03580 [Streptomyces sp. NBC_01314]
MNIEGGSLQQDHPLDQTLRTDPREQRHPSSGPIDRLLDEHGAMEVTVVDFGDVTIRPAD